MPRTRRSASFKVERTSRSVLFSFFFARLLSALALSRLPERLERSPLVEEPRLSRADLSPLSVVPEVSSPVASVEVVSVLLFSVVLVVELALLLLLLLAFFLEQPTAAKATTALRQITDSLLFIFDYSPYDGGYGSWHAG
jgi:hypothetical protein